MNENNVKRVWTLEVQAWHIVLLLAIQLIGLGIGYGKIVATQESFAKDLERIENQRVITKDEFDEWKTQVLSRMDRIENKIDGQYIKSDLK